MAGWSLRGQRPGFVPETRDLGCDVLLGVGEVCRPTSQRCEEAAPAGRQKPGLKQMVEEQALDIQK